MASRRRPPTFHVIRLAIWILAVEGLLACDTHRDQPKQVSNSPDVTQSSRRDVAAASGHSFQNSVVPPANHACLDELTPAQRSALLALAPDFSAWTRSQFDPNIAEADSSRSGCGLSVVRADFNGDGSLDAALIGRGRAQSYFAAVVSDSHGAYHADWVEPPIGLEPRDTTNRQVYLRLQPKGALTVPGEAGAPSRRKRLPSAAIVLMSGEGATLYSWKQGKFLRTDFGD